MPHVESAAASDGPPLQDAWHAEFQRLVPLWESLRNTSEVQMRFPCVLGVVLFRRLICYIISRCMRLEIAHKHSGLLVLLFWAMVFHMKYIL